MAHIQSATA